MPRVAITVQDVGFQSDLNPIVYTAADATNDHTMVNDSPGNTLLLIKNADAGAHVVTAVGVPDQWGHSVDLVTSVGAGDDAIMGPFAPQIFNQAGGLVNLDIDTDTSVSLAAIRPAAQSR